MSDDSVRVARLEVEIELLRQQVEESRRPAAPPKEAPLPAWCTPQGPYGINFNGPPPLCDVLPRVGVAPPTDHRGYWKDPCGLWRHPVSGEVAPAVEPPQAVGPVRTRGELADLELIDSMLPVEPPARRRRKQPEPAEE